MKNISVMNDGEDDDEPFRINSDNFPIINLPVIAVVIFVGNNSTHLEKASMITRIYSLPC